jgi:hypothetical protein
LFISCAYLSGSYCNPVNAVSTHQKNKIMKNLLLLSLLLSSVFNLKAISFKPLPAAPCTSGICITFSGEIGIKAQGCKKLGLSCIDVNVSVHNDLRTFNNPKPGSTTLMLTKISANLLEIGMRSSETGPLVIDMPIVFDSKVCAALGARSVTIKPGSYTTNKRSDGSLVAVVSIY